MSMGRKNCDALFQRQCVFFISAGEKNGVDATDQERSEKTTRLIFGEHAYVTFELAAAMWPQSLRYRDPPSHGGVTTAV